MRKEQTYNYILEHPGCDITEIAKAFGVSRATIKSHIYRMRDAGRVVLERQEKGSGTPNACYPVGDEKIFVPPLVYEEVFEYVKANPGCNAGDVSAQFRITRNHALRHLRKLVAKKRVTRKYKANEYLYWEIGAEPKSIPVEQQILNALENGPLHTTEIQKITGFTQETIDSELSRLTTIECDTQALGGGYYRNRKLEKLLVRSPWDAMLITKARSLNAIMGVA